MSPFILANKIILGLKYVKIYIYWHCIFDSCSLKLTTQLFRKACGFRLSLPPLLFLCKLQLKSLSLTHTHTQHLKWESRSSTIEASNGTHQTRYDIHEERVQKILDVWLPKAQTTKIEFFYFWNWRKRGSFIVLHFSWCLNDLFLVSMEMNKIEEMWGRKNHTFDFDIQRTGSFAFFFSMKSPVLSVFNVAKFFRFSTGFLNFFGLFRFNRKSSYIAPVGHRTEPRPDFRLDRSNRPVRSSSENTA